MKGEEMSYSLIVRGIPDYEFSPDEINHMQRTHPKYADDMRAALEIARKVGLPSAAITVMRTPNPYDPADEVVDISVRGTTRHRDFVAVMDGIVSQGPGKETLVAQHDAAAAYLKKNPCDHDWLVKDHPANMQCTRCTVILDRGLLHFPDGFAFA